VKDVEITLGAHEPHMRVIHQLCLHSPSQFLFPNASKCRLRLSPDLGSNFVPQDVERILNPDISALRIHINGPVGINRRTPERLSTFQSYVKIVDIIRAQCRQLRVLGGYIYLHPWAISSPLKTALQNLVTSQSSLESFETDAIDAFTSTSLQHIGSMPSLQYMKLERTRNPVRLEKNPDQPLFSSLKGLWIHEVLMPEDVAGALELIPQASSLLQRLRIDWNWFPLGPTPQHIFLFNICDSIANCHSLVELEFTCEFEAIEGKVTREQAESALDPILRLEKLQTLHLSLPQVASIGNEWLQRAAASFPSLRHLTMWWYGLSEISGTTLEGYIPIVSQCKDLRSLHIQPICKPLDGQDIKGEQVKVVELSNAALSLEDVGPLARCLLQMFPSLDRFQHSVGRGSEHMIEASSELNRLVKTVLRGD
jgi:hypothetical protein